jgi:hypothetical protein
MIEKRSFPRLPLNWEIEYQITKPASSRPILVKGGINDLGGGGFSFRSEAAYPAGALFQFAIKPAADLKPMVGVARVAWVRGLEGSYESGARFVWVNWKDMDAQTAVAQYVLDHQSTKPS